MRKNTKGFYTVEAAIFLPLVILAVLSLGYFMRIEGTWENCIHGAVDESLLVASKSYDRINAFSVGMAVSERINDDNPELSSMKLKSLKIMYSDGKTDDLTSYRIAAEMKLELPLGFSRTFVLDQGIKYRGFTGIINGTVAMGPAGLETDEIQQPVWIFPYAGEKYHQEECAHVSAAVEPAVLTSALKKKHSSCRLCKSEDIPIGSIVFVFGGEDTAYHMGTCASIIRHTTVIDKSEAIQKGYEPCSKCGG